MHIPKKMLVVDVAPRDGLQSLPKWIPTEDKIWLCDRLTDLGVPVVEAGSFVHPKVIPNMRDSEEVFARIKRKPTIGVATTPHTKPSHHGALGARTSAST